MESTELFRMQVIKAQLKLVWTKKGMNWSVSLLFRCPLELFLNRFSLTECSHGCVLQHSGIQPRRDCLLPETSGKKSSGGFSLSWLWSCAPPWTNNLGQRNTFSPDLELGPTYGQGLRPHELRGGRVFSPKEEVQTGHRDISFTVVFLLESQGI